MQKPLTVKDFLSVTPVPIEYMTYRSDAYTAKEGFIYATEKDAVVRNIDEFGIYQRNDIKPKLPAGQINLVGATPHTLRNTYLERSQGRKKEQVRLKNGIQLIIDLIDGFHSGAKQDDSGSYAIYPERMTTAVKTLCEKYGLLSWQDEKDEQLTPEEIQHQDIFNFYLDNIPKELITNVHDSVRQYSIYFCTDILTASHNILLLYNLFMMWKALFLGITDQEKQTLNKNILVSGIIYGFNDPKKTEVTHDEYRSIICMISKEIELFSTIAFIKGKPVLIPLYKNALEAAIGCMLSVVAKGIDGLEERTIAVCERCSKNYIKDHGRQKYCDICSNKTVRVREHRARKKAEREAQKNAQESEQ